METTIEKIQRIEKELTNAGFKIGYSHQNKGFWIHDGKWVHAQTKYNEKYNLNEPLIFPMGLSNVDPSNINNLNYLKNSLNLIDILKENGIEYKINENFEKNKEILKDTHQILRGLVDKLDTI